MLWGEGESVRRGWDFKPGPEGSLAGIPPSWGFSLPAGARGGPRQAQVKGWPWGGVYFGCVLPANTQAQ